MNVDTQDDAAPVPDGTMQGLPASDCAQGERVGVKAAPLTLDEPGSVASVSPQWSAARFDDIVSGAFDTTLDSPDLPRPQKRVLLPDAEQPKLHKVLAQVGLGSRVDMEAAIEAGRVLVNNEVAHVGMRIQRGDRIELDGAEVRYRVQGVGIRVLAYHKPAGEVVTQDDPQNRPTVFRKLPKLSGGKWQSVGRLDLNTEGLLLFTNSGELANRLMHPRFGLEREYAVRVLGVLQAQEREKLLGGVALEDGIAQFGSLEEGGVGEGVNRWYKVTLNEGRNREVRRMMEAVGHAVSRLIRIRYGRVQLPQGLRRGYWIELDAQDVQALQEMVGMDEQAVDEQVQGMIAQARRRGKLRGRFGRGSGRDAPRGQEERRLSSARHAQSGGSAAQAGMNTTDAQGMGAEAQAHEERLEGAQTREGQQGNRAAASRARNGQHTRVGSYGDSRAAERGGFSRRNVQGGTHVQDEYEEDSDPNPNLIDPQRTSVDFTRGARRKRSDGGGGGVDPMRTSFGYIGGDALQRQRADKSSLGGAGRRRTRR